MIRPYHAVAISHRRKDHEHTSVQRAMPRVVSVRRRTLPAARTLRPDGALSLLHVPQGARQRLRHLRRRAGGRIAVVVGAGRRGVVPIQRSRVGRSAAHATNLFVLPEQLHWRSGRSRVRVFDLPGAERFGINFCPPAAAACRASRRRSAASTYRQEASTAIPASHPNTTASWHRRLRGSKSMTICRAIQRRHRPGETESPDDRTGAASDGPGSDPPVQGSRASNSSTAAARLRRASLSAGFRVSLRRLAARSRRRRSGRRSMR